MNEHTLVIIFLAILLAVTALGAVLAAALEAVPLMVVLVACGYAVAFMAGRVATLRELGEDIFE